MRRHCAAQLSDKRRKKLRKSQKGDIRYESQTFSRCMQFAVSTMTSLTDRDLAALAATSEGARHERTP